MDSIFKFQTYRDLIQQQLEGDPHQKGAKSRLASAAGIQPAYLTHVLSGTAHINLDQAAHMARFWHFSEVETEYFLTLVSLDRSGSDLLRRHLQRRLAEIRKVSKDPFSEKQKETDFELASTYYSDPVYAAIHILLRIEKFQSLVMLAEHLGMTKETVLTYLQKLEAMGLALHSVNKWVAIARDIHVEPESPLAKLHHQHWRMRSLERMRGEQNDDLHYTAIHTLSEEDYKKIRTILLEAIRKSRRIVEPSADQSGAALILSWFKI